MQIEERSDGVIATVGRELDPAELGEPESAAKAHSGKGVKAPKQSNA